MARLQLMPQYDVRAQTCLADPEPIGMVANATGTRWGSVTLVCEFGPHCNRTGRVMVTNQRALISEPAPPTGDPPPPPRAAHSGIVQGTLALKPCCG